MRFASHIDDFCQHLVNAGYAERTVQTYRAHVKRFARYVERHYPRIHRVDQVRKDTLADFQSSLATGGADGGRLSAATQSLILSALRTFFAHLVKSDYILKDPASSMPLPKKANRVPRNVLPEGEVAELLRAVEPRGPVGLRDRAVLELLYGCGIRTTELCTLKVTDVDLKQQTVTIARGKGGKSRVVPIGQYAAHHIERYLEDGRGYFLRHCRRDRGHLFLSGWGNPFSSTTINRSVIRRVARRVGRSHELSCYTFRHSVATHLLANDVDIMYIAKLLGHSSLKSTQQYLHVEISDLKRIHALYHPRERRDTV